MNAQNLARMAYSSAAAPTRMPRNIEYDIFSRVTRRLKVEATRDVINFAELASALSDNRRLWGILAVDLASEENKLPVELRAKILSLANFVDQHTRQVLLKKVSADALIDINVAIMRGLRAQGTG